MTGFIIYITGFILMALVYYVINTSKWCYDIAVYWFDAYEEHTKAYWAYQSLKAGLLSWFGIIGLVVLFIIDGMFRLDDYIKRKLE